MPEIIPKSSETIQAQIATFAAEQVQDHEVRQDIFDSLGGVALGNGEDTSSADSYKADDSSVLGHSHTSENLLANKAEYLNFMRVVGGSRYNSIHGRTEMLQNYAHFAPTVAALKAELSDPATRNQHPNFLGEGSNSMVFSITEGDQSYAVRLPNGKRISPRAIDSHLAGAVHGNGIPHLEQIVAASYIDGVTIAEVMPGKEVGHLTVDEIVNVTDEHLGELVDVLLKANELGIEIDTKPSNFLYDPQVGYGIVDYHSSNSVNNHSKTQELGEVVGAVATPLDRAGFYGKPYRPLMTAEDYAHDLEFMKANLGVLERYRSIVKEKLKGDDTLRAMTAIDKRIASASSAINKYSDSNWVNETIEEDKQRQNRQKQQIENPDDNNWF
jgi:hypothetical protein